MSGLLDSEDCSSKEDSKLELEVEVIKHKLDAHLVEYELHKREQEARDKSQDEAYKKTIDAIERLAAATQGVVDAWVVVNGFQRFIKWLSGFAILGIAGKWLYEHFSKGG